MTHTPTPWVTRDLRYGTPEIYAGDRPVARCLLHIGTEDFPIAEANAAFIVKAVNNHDQLVEALRHFIAAGEPVHMDANLANARIEARAALAAAG